MSSSAENFVHAQNELDRIFELIIVFISILSAALLQYVSVVIPLRFASSNDLIEQMLAKNVRILFVPLLIVIFMWIVSRIQFGREDSPWRKVATQFCFSFALTTAWADIVYYLIFVFPTLSVEVFLYLFFITFGLVIAMQLVASLRYESKKVLVRETWLRGLGIALIAWILYLAILLFL